MQAFAYLFRIEFYTVKVVLGYIGPKIRHPFISSSENLLCSSYEKSGFFDITSSCRTENFLSSIVPFS